MYVPVTHFNTVSIENTFNDEMCMRRRYGSKLPFISQ
jgi:hypothetical protein